jgi:hypothetical protein
VGEKQNQLFQLSLNRSLKVDFQGSRVISDSGLLLVLESDERLGLHALIVEKHPRRSAKKEHATATPGPAATVPLQSAGRMRAQGATRMKIPSQ